MKIYDEDFGCLEKEQLRQIRLEEKTKEKERKKRRKKTLRCKIMAGS